MSIIDELITDRKKENLVEDDPKGKYDYRDYNRVGQAVNYVANKLGLAHVSGRTNFTRGEIPRDSAMTTYRKNIWYIVMAVTLTNSLPSNNHNILTLTGANQLEKALVDANKIADSYDLMRWNDVDAKNYTWTTLSNKNIKWDTRFVN